MTRTRRATAAVAVLTMCLAAAGCGTDDPGPPSSTEEQTSPTPPTTTEQSSPTTEPTTASGCFEDMTSEAIPPELSNVSFPDRTIVYDVDVRGDNGVLLTGVTNLLFRAAVYQMRESYSDPPFGIIGTDEGEDAVGANWSGPGISGRWVISDISAVCPGDTEVKILWTSGGSLGN